MYCPATVTAPTPCGSVKAWAERFAGATVTTATIAAPGKKSRFELTSRKCQVET